MWEEYSDTFNLLDHPKELQIVYSDGSVQDVVLENIVSEYQTVELLDIPTSSITLRFGEYYASTEGVKDVFGVGRIAFEGMKKVEREKPVQTTPSVSATESSPSQSGKNNAWLYIIIVSGVTLGVMALIFGSKKQRVIKEQSTEPSSLEKPKTDEN